MSSLDTSIQRDNLVKSSSSLKNCLTAAAALRKYLPLNLISEYEEREIFDYKEIWFVGKEGVQKVKGSILKEPNNGYDDSRGDY